MMPQLMPPRSRLILHQYHPVSLLNDRPLQGGSPICSVIGSALTHNFKLFPTIQGYRNATLALAILLGRGTEHNTQDMAQG